LSLRLDPFGHDGEAESVRQRGDARDDRSVVRVAGHRHDERPVDLQLLDGEPPQVGQRGIPGAEVVDRQVHAQLPETLQDPDCAIRVIHQHGLGDLQPQCIGGQPRTQQHVLHGRLQTRVAELARGKVHSDLQRREVEVLGTPRSRLHAGEFKDSGAEPDDQSGLFGDPDEFHG
jgi:hypothetical protein